MGAAKTDQYTEKQQTIARFAKALGHPARVSIIEYLLKVNSCICSNIVDELPLAQSTVSQHLKELKNAGIIQGTIEGNSVCYCINETAVKELLKYFNHISINISNKKMKCC